MSKNSPRGFCSLSCLTVEAMLQLAVSSGKASWTDSLSHDVEETNTHPSRIYQPLQNLATPSEFTHHFRIYPHLQDLRTPSELAGIDMGLW